MLNEAGLFEVVYFSYFYSVQRSLKTSINNNLWQKGV